jgi:hypothetical protein
MTSRKLKTVKQFSIDNPAFSEASIRWQVFNEGSNGLKESGAIVRMGRRVLVDEDRWFQWLDSQNGIAPQAAA